MTPKFIVVHHSLTEDGKTVSWGAIRKYHTEVMGFKDCGYHYGLELINDHYEILKGRMDNEDGAHCLGFNNRSLGICVVGNFDIIPPSEKQMNLLAKFIHSLMEIYGIKSYGVIGHRESYEMMDRPVAKTCPGILFSMQELRKRL